MKVGDKVRLAHFHGSLTDHYRASRTDVGVIKSIEEALELNVLTQYIEVLWDDGISWHFRHMLVLESEE